MLEPPYEASSRDRPRSPLRMGSEVLDVPSRSRTNLSTPAPTQNAEALSQLNGTSSYARDAPPQLAPILNGSHQSHLADLEPPRPSSLQPPPQSAFAEPIRDSEGFSLPPQKIDPITQAQQDAISEGGAPAYNVNIRDAPIQEEGAASEAALASVANKLVCITSSLILHVLTRRSKLRHLYLAEVARCVVVALTALVQYRAAL